MDIAFNHSRNEYLVVWRQFQFFSSRVYGRRVRGDGVPMQPQEISIAVKDAGFFHPVVAALPTGTHLGQYLVAFLRCELGGTCDIWAQRVGSEGMLEGDAFQMSNTPGDERAAAIAASEHDYEYLVAWPRQLSSEPNQPWVVQARTVGLRGVAGDQEYTLGGENISRVALANGPRNDFLLVLSEEIPFALPHIDGHLWGSHRVYLPQVLR
jgi:hypothetical protein